MNESIYMCIYIYMYTLGALAFGCGVHVEKGVLRVERACSKFYSERQV